MPTRPRDWMPVERYTVIVKIWLALYGSELLIDAAPGRTVPWAQRWLPSEPE